jgi:hypothetical protein
VIAKNRECVGGDGASGDVNHSGSKFARDLVHIGDHQQKALRRGEGRSQRTGLEGAMERPRGATFALHFHDLWNGAPDILAAFDHPLIG